MVNVDINTLVKALTRIVNKNVVVEVTCDNKTIPIIVRCFEYQEKEHFLYFGDYSCKRWQFGIKKNEIKNVVVEVDGIGFEVGEMKYKLIY